MQKRIDWLVVPAILACAFLSLTITPAYAGWGHRFTRSVLPSLVQRAAVSVIQQELYDLESERSAVDSPVNAPPDAARTRVTAGANLDSPGVSRFSGYHWLPRPAIDYLRDGDDTQSTSLPKQIPLFTAHPPSRSSFDSPVRSHPLPSSAVAQSFAQGLAGNYSYEQLVSANVFEKDPLHGSVFKRQEKVKYIILHSTETGSPADARRVIQSWNNRGLRHPGAQFVVDRDGTICSTTNPDLATVHIDTSKALAGYSNDNSVGIEIVRSGKQQYTRSQLDSVTCLVSYLQGHYGVPDTNVTTHHHVQPSDRSDPVGFDLVAFESDKTALRTSALAHGARFELDRGSGSAVAYSKSVLSTMPKPAPDFRLPRN